MKSNKGITLVSLVVTIIILIILASVSINLTLGENGIITKAKEAKEKTEQAKLNEEIALNELYTQMESENSNISYDSIAKLTEFKKKIADYIEEAGGTKPEYTADATTFGESIKAIVKEVTKDATATAEDITKGKTAYVNGNLITGTKNTQNITNNFDKNKLIPIMTSATAPSGNVTASSTYNSTWSPYLAFDGIIGPYNLWAPSSGVKNGWIQYNFPKETTASSCFIDIRTGITEAYGVGTDIVLTLQSSLDGNTYETIAEKSTFINGNHQFNPIWLNFESTTAKYFKLTFETTGYLNVENYWSGGFSMIQLYN